MNQIKESKESDKVKIYFDAGKFKGNTFEQNINTVNKLYLGIGIKISDIPYIYMKENDNYIYLSANTFTIINKDKEVEINYPISFMYNVFYHDNFLFYLEENNELRVYEFDPQNLSIKIHTVEKTISEKENGENPQRKEGNNTKEAKEGTNKKEESKKVKEPNKKKQSDNVKKSIQKEKEDIITDKDKVEKILKKLEKIKNNNIKEDYEILCDILGNDLNIKLEKQYPKEIKGSTFEIKDDESKQIRLTCKIKKIEYQIDSTGMIRERLNVEKGIKKFKDGIDFITNYVRIKDKITINNSFKSPILFKNFEEEEIPPNQVIMCEIKSGFDIVGLKSQLTDRIKAIRKFIFNKDETPLYYIGLVNLDSKNIDKLVEYSNFDFDINEKVLIVAVIDYVYFGMDLSYEVSDGYLLLKAIGNLEKKMDKRMDNLERKFDDNFKNIGENFKNLFWELKRLNPDFNLNYKPYSAKDINTNNKEEKIGS